MVTLENNNHKVNEGWTTGSKFYFDFVFTIIFLSKNKYEKSQDLNHPNNPNMTLLKVKNTWKLISDLYKILTLAKQHNWFCI